MLAVVHLRGLPKVVPLVRDAARLSAVRSFVSCRSYSAKKPSTPSRYLEPVPDRGIASKWQRCDLSGDGQATAISVDEGEPILLATEGLRRQLGGLRALGIGAATDHTWRYRCTRSR